MGSLNDLDVARFASYRPGSNRISHFVFRGQGRLIHFQRLLWAQFSLYVAQEALYHIYINVSYSSIDMWYFNTPNDQIQIIKAGDFWFWAWAGILIQVAINHRLRIELIEMTISTNPKPATHRSLHENTMTAEIEATGVGLQIKPETYIFFVWTAFAPFLEHCTPWCVCTYRVVYSFKWSKFHLLQDRLRAFIILFSIKECKNNNPGSLDDFISVLLLSSACCNYPRVSAKPKGSICLLEK